MKVSTYSEILGQSDPITSRKVNWTQRKTPTRALLRYVNCFWWKTARVGSWLHIYIGVEPCFFPSDSNFSFKWLFLRETVETGDKNRGDFHCMQMSLLMSMRYIFDDDCTNWRTKLITFWLFGSDVIFPESRHLTFAPHVHRIESCERCRAFPKRVGPRILSLEIVYYFGTTDYFSGRKQEQSFEQIFLKNNK